MGYVLRIADSLDSGPVRELVARVLLEYGMVFDAPGTDADLRDIGESYSRRGGCFHVLVDEQDRVVGSVGLMAKGDGEAELRKMYLDPAVRGQGYGRMMLRAVIDDARRLGFRRIRLETASPMVAAQGLYVAHGFRRVEGRHVETARCDRAYELDLTADRHAREGLSKT